MAVRVVHKLQHHTLGVARRTAPEAHTRRASRPKPGGWEGWTSCMGESGARCVGMSGGNMAHRGRLLEEDADAATRGVFDGPFGLVFEHVELQAVTERPQKGTGQRAGVSMGADTNANSLGRWLTPGW